MIKIRYKKIKYRTKIIAFHGLSRTSQYHAWNSMMTRVYSKNGPKYKLYGGRGIKVCKRWHKFINFWEDMKEGYQKGLSLDRIDNNGDYEPGNCRWATLTEQNNNKRNNLVIESNGKKMNLGQWARFSGISRDTIRRRLKEGWKPEEIFKTPAHGYRSLLEFNGKKQTTKQWSKELKIPVSTIRDRMNRYNWSINDTLSTPIQKNKKRFVTYQGKTLSILEWAERLKLPYNRIYARIVYGGQTVEQAFETPIKKYDPIK